MSEITPEKVEALRLDLACQPRMVESATVLAVISGYQSLMADALALSDKLHAAQSGSAKTPITYTATGFGTTTTEATGQVVLNIDTPDGRVHIDLGTEFAEPMGLLLRDDPEESDGAFLRWEDDEHGTENAKHFRAVVEGEQTPIVLPAGSGLDYVNGDDGYHWLTCGTCEEQLVEVKAGTSLREMTDKVASHRCAEAAQAEQERGEAADHG